MADIYIPKGDKGYNIHFTVRDANGDAFAITAYTVTLKVWKPEYPETLLLSGVCVIEDGAAGTCRYAVAATNFDTVGKYKAELEFTASGVIQSTRSFDLEVIESG